MAVPFTTYSSFVSRHFPCRVQKIPINAGVGCPTRGGKGGGSGCAFCNGKSFSPPYCASSKDVCRQIEEGKVFFSRKSPADGETAYLAYFQSGTNTYAPPSVMMPLFRAALGADAVKGLVIATRPDCLGEEWVECLRYLAMRTFVLVEVGVESASDEVLRLMGRGHDFECSRRAILSLHNCGAFVGAHVILGLPGESEESVLRQADVLSALPVDVLKLHQLQILRGTLLEKKYCSDPTSVPLLTCEEYAALAASYLERLSPQIAIERFVSQSPAPDLVAPRWGVKNGEVARRVVTLLERRKSRQGRLCRC